MIIEVVLRKVGEDRHVEFDTVNALLIERVGTDFHHAGLAPGASICAIICVDFQSFRAWCDAPE